MEWNTVDAVVVQNCIDLYSRSHAGQKVCRFENEYCQGNIKWFFYCKQRTQFSQSKPALEVAGVTANVISLHRMSRDSLLVRAPDSWSKGCEFESRQKRRENFLLEIQLCELTLIRCPIRPRVTEVARKRPRSFCQKCGWPVTPKHANTLDPTKSEWADHAAVQA